MEIILVILFAALLIGAFSLHRVRVYKARCLISAWAEVNDVSVIRLEECAFFRRYYPMHGTSNAQLVFHFTAVLPSGEEKEGYCRCGGYLTGLRSKDFEVVWSDQSPNPDLRFFL